MNKKHVLGIGFFLSILLMGFFFINVGAQPKEVQKNIFKYGGVFTRAHGSSRYQTSYQTNGITFHSNGDWTHQLGNILFHKDGSFSRNIGSRWYHSNGGYSQKAGNTIYHSNKTYSRIFGNIIYHSNGSISHRFAHSPYIQIKNIKSNNTEAVEKEKENSGRYYDFDHNPIYE